MTQEHSQNSPGAPTRAEAIASVLEACDGHYGRVLAADDVATDEPWPTLRWKRRSIEVLTELHRERPGSTWAEGKRYTFLRCKHCYQLYHRHGASREVAERLNVPLHLRGLICPPPRSSR